MERYGILPSKDEDQRWKYNHGRGVGFYTNGVIRGFSCPPRSNCCSFCKREFRSAQALGGHMNVHRRERARLRQSPPWDSTLPPNPKPNIYKSKTLIPNLNNAPPSPFPVRSPPSPPHPPRMMTTIATQDQVKFSLFGHQYTLLKSQSPFEQAKIRGLVIEEQSAMKLELAMGRYRPHLDDGSDLELRLGFF